MQKFSSYIFFLFLLSGICFLSGCVDDSVPDPKPEINFAPVPKTVSLVPGDTIQLNLKVNSKNKLTSFTIASSETSALLQDVTTFPLSSYQYETNIKEKIDSSRRAGDQIVYMIKATTDKGEATERAFTVNVFYPKPNITFSPKDQTVSIAAGDTLNLAVRVNCKSKLTSFTIASSESSALLQNVTSFPVSRYKYETKLTEIIDSNKKAGDQIAYTFKATTDRGEFTEQVYKVTVK
jgi:hypothetical protein